MSTRSNIVVNYGDSKIFIYRHWDGYLEATGYDIASTLIHHSNPNSFVRALLSKKEDSSFTRAANYQYELTSEIHGDIEWLYTITFPQLFFYQKDHFYSDDDIFINFEIKKRKYDTNPAIGWETIRRLKLDPKNTQSMDQDLNFIYQAHLKMLKKSA